MPGPYLFAGDRQLAVSALQALIARQDPPLVLCVSDRPTASHAEQLVEIFLGAGGQEIVTGSALQTVAVRTRLAGMALEMALSVHFPELVRPEVLTLPTRGWLNLHPSFLPYNRGWHTPSWAILDGTPAGVSLHEMAEALDAGAIIARQRVTIEPADTADRLYQRLLAAELELLLDTWPLVRSGDPWPVIPNEVEGGTIHHRRELLDDQVQLIDLDSSTTARLVIDHLRALTTDRWEEAAQFVVDGRTYRARIDIRADEPGGIG